MQPVPHAPSQQRSRSCSHPPRLTQLQAGSAVFRAAILHVLPSSQPAAQSFVQPLITILHVLPSSKPAAQSFVQPSSTSYPAPSRQRSRSCSHPPRLTQLPASSAVVRAVVRAAIFRVLPISQLPAQSYVQPSSASYPAPSRQRSRSYSHAPRLTQLPLSYTHHSHNILHLFVKFIFYFM